LRSEIDVILQKGVCFIAIVNVGLLAKIEEESQLVVLCVWFDQTEVKLLEFGPGFILA
jgi:hypothetical protein